jgi:predicted metalloprotease
LYPNENFMVSHNLLTPSTTLSNAELLSRYQAAQQTVDQWLQDSRFAGIWPQLQQIQGRLGRILSGAMR